jgi:hypothetical protein
MPESPPTRGGRAPEPEQVALGLGRIVAFHHRSSAWHHHPLRESLPLLLKRRCDRTLGGAPGVRRGVLRRRQPARQPGLRGESKWLYKYIPKCPMPLNGLERQVSTSSNRDACPRAHTRGRWGRRRTATPRPRRRSASR